MIQFSGAKNDYGWMSNFYRCDIKYKNKIWKLEVLEKVI